MYFLFRAVRHDGSHFYVHAYDSVQAMIFCRDARDPVAFVELA